MSKNLNENRTASDDDEGQRAMDDCAGALPSDKADDSEGGTRCGRTVLKHSVGNEPLDSEECELLLKGQKQPQPQCSHVNFEEKHTSKKQQDRDAREMSTYSPHKSQLKHQKSGFQLDGLRSPAQGENTSTLNNGSSSAQQTTGADKSNLEQKAVTDSSGNTTIAPTSHSFNLPPPHHQRPDSEWRGPKIWRNFVRDWPIISQPLAILVILLLLWIMGYSEIPKYASPRTTIMRIVFLFVGAQGLGIAVTFLHLPDIVGMIFFGMLYTNLGLADFSGYEEFEAILRELALINIMLLAGLGLNGSAFKKLWMIITRLTLVPTIVEVAAICVLAHYLINMPWFWGVLLGLVITAVSPNVVVTVMLKLKEEKLGLNNGIHTLIYAMTTCNDVIAVFLYGVILGVIFHQGKSSYQVLQGPVGIVVGVVYGYVFGLLLVYLPSRKSKYVSGLRFAMIVCGGCVSVMGSRAMGYPSAGALGCVTVAFTAGTLWKKQKGGISSASVTDRLDLLWKFLKPVSFALIGKELNFSVLDARTVGYGLIIIAVASVFRLAGSYVSTAGAQLTTKERLYVTISGFPKATVQAALGPIALDLARKLNSDDDVVELANSVLVISVIAIILTAPLGAILMIRLAPHWLKYGDDPDEVDMNGAPEQTQDDDIAIITVGDNGNVMDSSHTNVAYDHGNSGR